LTASTPDPARSQMAAHSKLGVGSVADATVVVHDTDGGITCALACTTTPIAAASSTRIPRCSGAS